MIVQLQLASLILIGLAILYVQWLILNHATKSTEVTREYLEMARSYWQVSLRNTEEAKATAANVQINVNDISRTVGMIAASRLEIEKGSR